MSKVFVVQEPMTMRNGRPSRRFSMEPAKEFGELVFVLDWSELRDLGRTQEDTDAILWLIRDRLDEHEYNSEEDYILMTGNWSAMAMVVIAALELGDEVNLLQWDREIPGYQIIKVDVCSLRPQKGRIA